MVVLICTLILLLLVLFIFLLFGVAPVALVVDLLLYIVFSLCSC